MGLSLAVAALDCLDGPATYNRSLQAAVKRDGTWVEVPGALALGANWTRDSATIVFGQERTISNGTQTDQVFTDACIMASQDIGQTVAFLNSDEAAVDNLLGGIRPLTGSPITIQPGQTLRIPSFRIPIQ